MTIYANLTPTQRAAYIKRSARNVEIRRRRNKRKGLCICGDTLRWRKGRDGRMRRGRTCQGCLDMRKLKEAARQ